MSERVVVVVDPDAGLCAELRAQLEPHAVKVEQVDAVKVLDLDDPPNAIVVCIDPLPGGWAVADRIRRVAMLRAVPLMVLSAEADDDAMREHRRGPFRADDYLRKPVAPDSLARRVMAILRDVESVDDDDAEMVMEVEMPGTSADEEDAIEVGEHDAVSEHPDPAAPPSPVAHEVSLAPPGKPASSMFTPSSVAAVVRSFTPLSVPAVAAAKPAATETAVPIASVATAVPVPSVAAVPVAAGAPAGGSSLLASIANAPSPFPPPPAAKPAGALSPALERLRTRTPVATRVAETPRPVEPPHATPGQDALSQEIVTQLREENARLQRELADAKARIATTALPSTSASLARDREVLTLREVINKKEKENLDLRESLDSKDRQILDHKDKLREGDKTRRELEEKLLTVEKELVASRERIENATRDRDTLSEHERGYQQKLEEMATRELAYKQRVEDAMKKLERAAAEIEQLRARLAGDAEIFRSTTAQLRQMEAEKSALIEAQLKDKAAFEARIAELQRDRDGSRSSLESELAQLQEQARRALERLQRDESAVARARKALGIALAVLDEAHPPGNGDLPSGTGPLPHS